MSTWPRIRWRLGHNRFLRQLHGGGFHFSSYLYGGCSAPRAKKRDTRSDRAAASTNGTSIRENPLSRQVKWNATELKMRVIGRERIRDRVAYAVEVPLQASMRQVLLFDAE